MGIRFIQIVCDFIILLLLHLVSFCLPDRCFDNVRINYNESLFSSQSVYGRIETSRNCVDTYEAKVRSVAQETFSSCPVGLLSVELGPVARFEDMAHVLPHIELNISVAVHEYVDSVFIRLQCVYAPDAEDIYCHDAQRMMSEGQWLWPCRAVTFHRKDVFSLPFYFGYSCFRVFGLSQYMVNVTVFPQNCRSTLLITSPSDVQLHPSIAEYYGSEDARSKLSPLLIVDFSEEDGIWLRVEGPALQISRSIAVSVFERRSDGTLHPLQTFTIARPTTGLKWRNVAKGSYVAYAHIPRHDCLLVCDEVAASPSGCKMCVHTMLNFTLDQDRASLSWRSLRRMRDSSFSILFALGSIVLVSAFCGMIYVLFLRRRVRRSPVRVQEIELQSKPIVLILTPDDCDEHSEVVLLLSRFLERHAGVTVLLDYREMDSSAVPSRWLVDSLCRSSRVLIIVSPCSGLVLNGQHLRKRRPFPDLFETAMDMIIREHTQNISSNKYLICRLPYSPPTPDQLNLLGFPQVEVPSDLARLTALIHAIDVYGLNEAHNSSELAELSSAIESMKKLMESDPTWIVRRLDNEDDRMLVSNVLEVSEKKNFLQTAEDRRQAADQFGLLPPEENESEAADEPSEFPLLPPDSSDED
ncbi:unnamed protein product [Cylicocyclus nassatus]|uniref:SEFIR domain-containing protein n=1 Tax=Cylicocyclus nassatus TaxID=53992 RepID=A0AA36H848_CYLNA|nr:unnamed protein product [Cylicocyclus nassatus]